MQELACSIWSCLNYPGVPVAEYAFTVGITQRVDTAVIASKDFTKIPQRKLRTGKSVNVSNLRSNLNVN